MARRRIVLPGISHRLSAEALTIPSETCFGDSTPRALAPRLCARSSATAATSSIVPKKFGELDQYTRGPLTVIERSKSSISRDHRTEISDERGMFPVCVA